MSGTPCGWLNSAADDDSPNSSRAIPASTISRRKPGDGGSRWAFFAVASSCACFHEPTVPALPSFSPSIHTLQTSPRCPDRRFSWTCITGLGSDIRCPSHLAEGEDHTDGAFNARPVSLTLDPCAARCEPKRKMRVDGVAVRESAALRMRGFGYGADSHLWLARGPVGAARNDLGERDRAARCDGRQRCIAPDRP